MAPTRGANIAIVLPLPETPPASSPEARKAMQGNRRVDTKPELALRSAVHALGLRFRKDFPIADVERRTRADLVFTRDRVAVFVDGCYWHGCPEHCRVPSSNNAYWLAKIERNRQRDQRVDQALREAGWAVVRVWEHEPTGSAAARVAAVVRRRRAHFSRRTRR
jgi:DNA mismatch endonuclease (patch repair protein)